ncbi:hypothetical protein JZ751_026456 [Albula glossodonta]|uniref:RING-type E3 ubiquitin transferase n=1 Tax=Albula glossodonta TaxID=121402 RepID=A0A8T2P9L7_9TELE|nr:hypothetical protein JZ751_026456 [Albula glossodonta]
MAAEGRTVIVSGVPTGIEEKRLTDKLCIHFLRKRHGGGDISSIILPKSTPGSAIITFEESEVAQRVVQYGKHILSVDDKTFELTVSLFCKDVDPDEVFLGVEVMVDYSRLPLGKIAVSCLQKSFPAVHFSFIPKQGLCKLKGRFSEVQALINQLLTLIDPQASAATTSLETTGSTNNLSSRGKTSSVDEPVYHLRCNDRQMESWFAKQASSHDLESLGNSERSDHSNHELDNYQQGKDSAGTRLQETPLEEYFLVMDSDIFKYLQKHCGEYQDILSQNRVEAVDICTQDITTVYLQTGEATVGEGVKRVKRVHQELGKLYQDKEAQLRKEQVLKEVISTEDLQQAFKALQQQLPRIMLSDDELYIYVVGSGSDVSEAKQFFLDMQKATDESRLGRAGCTSLGHDIDSLFLPSSSASPSDSPGSIFDAGEIHMRQKAYKKDIVGSGRDVLEAKQFILDKQWTGSGSRMESGIDTKPLLRSDKAFLFQPPTTTSSAVNMESTDSREMDTVQKSYRKDKMEAGKGYKLAARFMEAGNKTPWDAELGSYLSDTTVPQNTQKDLSCSTSKKISENRHWLGALPASVSGNLGVEFGRYSLKGHQGLSHIGKDMLLRRPCRNTALPSKPVHFTNAQSTMHHLDLFGSKVAQTTEMPLSGLETQSKLRRVHSFSGRVRSKQDSRDSTIPADIHMKTNRARTSSLSNSTADTQEVYNFEIVVPYSVWFYMKDCYSTLLEKITTDLSVKEYKSGSSFTLHLRGTDSTKVDSSQKELQNLIAMVNTDFCQKELPLEKLGMTNPKDETLEVRCMELRNKFKKVKILLGTNSVFIMGPNQLCEQVVSKLMDIFHNGMDKKEEMKEGLDGPSSEYLFPDNQVPLPETLIGDTKDKQTTSRNQGKTNKARTSSFSDSGVDAQDVYIVEVLVSYFVWLYMKDCYSLQIENLTTDVHVKECKSGSSFSLHLRGADSARVSVCQKELQNLIAMVNTDFYQKHLSLEKLGLTNPKDETLEMSCMELQNTYKKVKILPRTKSIFILGPNQQCEQVVSLLMEVFHNGIIGKKMKEGQDGPSSSTYLFPENQDSLPRTLTDYSKDQQTASGSHNLPREDVFQATSHISLDSPQYSGVTQIGEELGPNSRRTDSLQGKDSSQMEKESEIRGEGGSHSAEQKDTFFNFLGLTKSRERTDTSLDQPTETAQTAISPKDSGSISLPNLAYFTEKAVVQNKENIPKPHNISTDKRPLPPGLEELQNPEGKDPKHQDACGAEQSRDSNDTPEEQGQSCSCGAGRGSISRMACGVAFCQQCLHVHVSCKVCSKGIRGTMSWSEMCMTLPGHIKDMTLKITYTVPDGIQGEDHPSPGSPFQGGVFDAFLPLNKQTKRLLPLLKRAFDEGLTFTVVEGHKVARVTWASIPHKTKMSGGKSVNGYPDSGFLRCLTEALKSLSFGEDRDIAEDQDKIKN